LGRWNRLERVVELEGDLDGEWRARLLLIAARCPVHRTLKGEVVVAPRLTS
jgi:putative redox protein